MNEENVEVIGSSHWAKEHPYIAPGDTVALIRELATVIARDLYGNLIVRFDEKEGTPILSLGYEELLKIDPIIFDEALNPNELKDCIHAGRGNVFLAGDRGVYIAAGKDKSIAMNFTYCPKCGEKL